MNILVIGNNFSKYDEILEFEFKQMGDSVDRIVYCGLLPNRSKFHSKSVSFIFYWIATLISYPSRVIISFKLFFLLQKYDFILCVNGSFLIYEIIKYSKYSNKIFIWLMDPICKFPRSLIFNKISQVFSYSEHDSRKYGLRFLPLFSALNVRSNFSLNDNSANVKKQFSIAFIGAIDLYRLFMLEELARRSKPNSKSIFIGGVFGKLSQAKFLYKNSNYFNNLKNLLHIRRFSFDEINSIYSSSEYIFNYNVGDHSGASMRFFEALELDLGQLCDSVVVKSRYCNLVLKVCQTNTIFGFPVYKSSLDLSDIKNAVSVRNRLLHLKKVYLRLN